MATFSWTFPLFDVAPSEDGLTLVVKTIHWRYRATDGDLAAEIYGTTALGPADAADFIPYEQITEAWAIARVTEKEGGPALEEAALSRLQQVASPPVVPLPPPFG